VYAQNKEKSKLLFAHTEHTTG